MKRFFFAVAVLAAAMACRAADDVALFDGKSLNGWKEVDFAGKGKVAIKDGGVLEIGMGEMLTGVVYTNAPVRMNYEITLDARKTMGTDFFCGLTFPYETNSCTLILGGWGGGLTGMSSVDGMDASENTTTGFFEFAMNTWYKIKLRVTPEKIEAWVDEKNLFKFEVADHKLGMRPGDIEMCMPLGIATWQTRGELRNIKVRKLE